MMVDTSVIKVSSRYGVLGGVVSFVFGLALYLLYKQNPYSEQTELFSTLIFVPVFVFLGVKYFKKYINPELSFAEAFKVAILITLFLAITVALLQLLYTLILGQDLVPQFILEAQTELVKSKLELTKSVGVDNYEMMLKEVSNRSALSLGLKQITLRWLVGFFVSIVSAVFFRK
ncbi:DUF4199 family protein [Nibribacter ruber]|uniref:DUF4199 family protein n=1 Tax=Nibribacter ruber TaxID=2698458 RepID=A0A6P1P1I5_9BACT|nr:DUF4199 domain-containing protein [Nibribacter ruber]QHL87713.1 DUF4199 family protein [Nibribacter ruber]